MRKAIRFIASMLIIIAFILAYGTCGALDANDITESVAWLLLAIVAALAGFGLIGLHCTVEKDEYDY